ncbi:MAG: dihydropteroate synthase [Longimicrobiales bacterium]|nr:dihydropteroate synthase [Longimicrobiales bacterium]
MSDAVSSLPAHRTTGTGSTSGAGPRSRLWRTARGPLSLDRPRVMGILNVTPDSFWDGGRYAGVDAALRQAERLVAEGADLVDVGGESTRPGAESVPAEEERRRVVPVVDALVREWPELLVSVDTVKAAVARPALEAGAAVINDVSGLRLDSALPAACGEAGAGVVVMHSRGGVAEMASYDTARYGDDPVGEIVGELEDALERARAGGIADDAVVLDPGLGFSKRTAESVAVIRELDRIAALGRPVLLGPSRKRFVGELAGGLPAEERLPGTIAACVAGLERGARLFRVHDVAPVRRALAVAEAVRS